MTTTSDHRWFWTILARERELQTMHDRGYSAMCEEAMADSYVLRS